MLDLRSGTLGLPGRNSRSGVMQRSELVECFPLLRCQPSIKFHYRRTQATQRLQRGRAEPFDVFETLGEGRQRTGLKSGRGQCRTSLPDRFDRVARTRAELVPRRELRVRKRQFYAAKGESARKQRVEVAANPRRRVCRQSWTCRWRGWRLRHGRHDLRADQYDTCCHCNERRVFSHQKSSFRN